MYGLWLKYFVVYYCGRFMMGQKPFWSRNWIHNHIPMIHKTQGILLLLSSGFWFTLINSGIIKLRLHKDSGLIMLLIKPTKTVSSSMTMRFWGIIKLTFKTSLYGLFNHRYITSVDSKSRWLRLKLTCFDWVIKTAGCGVPSHGCKKKHSNWKRKNKFLNLDFWFCRCNKMKLIIFQSIENKEKINGHHCLVP